METVEVKKEDVLKAHENANEKGKKLIEDLYPTLFVKDIKERVKTMKDVCDILGINYDTFMNSILGLPKDVQGCTKVRLIAQALNEGWQPNWEDSSEKKYYPWLRFVSGSGFSFFDCLCGRTDSGVGSRLCFKSEELCKYAAKQFEKEYKELFNY